MSRPAFTDMFARTGNSEVESNQTFQGMRFRERGRLQLDSWLSRRSSAGSSTLPSTGRRISIEEIWNGSLITQRLDRIDSGCPAGWNVAGRSRHDAEQYNDHGKRYGISGRHPEELQLARN
jgi:hypothetical protein